ncbi:MAG: DUF6090 family protein [Robiginitalea sp.]|uniref:DUF6090 family protein n=1 Tax=Robiginitalea sp. TaxID=1902411 RepID=UPI003C743D1D
MIKFFRKIRQRLLTENNFNRYLVYAIGEIILVVIGILIALQINNWNQNRLNENLEYQYYEVDWTKSGVFNLANVYRGNLKGKMPHDIQTEIRSKCGDIFIQDRNG